MVIIAITTCIAPRPGQLDGSEMRVEKADSGSRSRADEAQPSRNREISRYRVGRRINILVAVSSQFRRAIEVEGGCRP